MGLERGRVDADGNLKCCARNAPQKAETDDIAYVGASLRFLSNERLVVKHPVRELFWSLVQCVHTDIIQMKGWALRISRRVMFMCCD